MMISESELTLETRARLLSMKLGFRISTKYLSWVFKTLGISKRKLAKLYRPICDEPLNVRENMYKLRLRIEQVLT